MKQKSVRRLLLWESVESSGDHDFSALTESILNRLEFLVPDGEAEADGPSAFAVEVEGGAWHSGDAVAVD